MRTQRATIEAPRDSPGGRALPSTYQRGLDALVVNYPGCRVDLANAQNAIEEGSKKEFLKLFRRLKVEQVAHQHYIETRVNSKKISDELGYPGIESDKQKLQNFFKENRPTAQNIKIFNEKVEGLRNKNAVARGDRSHPHITELLKLKLTYPGCEEDVQEALQTHYSRPLTKFQDKIHSLKTKQSLFMGNRSHWRLVQLNSLELTYPRWQRDITAAEDWHIHNAENRENHVLFHEIIEGMLKKQSLYLEYVLQRRQPQTKAGKKSKKRDEADVVLDADELYEKMVKRKNEEKKVLTRQLRCRDEEREPSTHWGRS